MQERDQKQKTAEFWLPELSPTRCFHRKKMKRCTQNITESPMEQTNPNHNLQSLIPIMSNISRNQLNRQRPIHRNEQRWRQTKCSTSK